METSNRIDGYVYVARIIDHGGKFVNGYHKIGLSKQYKVRETQLNSTHLPFDVLMVRVFETTNMKQIEGLLHLCFEDYRVVKEYDYRKNITTEWFDFNDIDAFNDRIDKFIEFMSMYGTKEIDISRSIDSDTTLTKEEKEEAKENVRRAKAYKFTLKIGETIYDDDTYQTENFIKAFEHILENIGEENLIKYGKCVRKKKEDFIGFRTIDSANFDRATAIKPLKDLFIFSYFGMKTKKRMIDDLCERFNIKDISVTISGY